MPRRSRKKIKDLVDLLEDPEGTYVGGDYEDILELMENEEDESEEDEDQEEEEQ